MDEYNYIKEYLDDINWQIRHSDKFNFYSKWGRFKDMLINIRKCMNREYDRNGAEFEHAVVDFMMYHNSSLDDACPQEFFKLLTFTKELIRKNINEYIRIVSVHLNTDTADDQSLSELTNVVIGSDVWEEFLDFTSDLEAADVEDGHIIGIDVIEL